MDTASDPLRGRATLPQVEHLHGLVCDILTAALEEMLTSGKPQARIIGVTIAYLKLCEVTAPQSTSHKAEAMQALLDQMPSFTDDGQIVEGSGP